MDENRKVAIHRSYAGKYTLSTFKATIKGWEMTSEREYITFEGVLRDARKFLETGNYNN